MSSLKLLRFTIVALFLWFGTQQLIDPSTWVGFLPEFTGYFPIPGEMLVQINGLMEVILAIALAVGIFTRPVAAFLALHLFGIAATTLGAIGVRDTALGLACLAITFSPADDWTIDAKTKKSA